MERGGRFYTEKGGEAFLNEKFFVESCLKSSWMGEKRLGKLTWRLGGRRKVLSSQKKKPDLRSLKRPGVEKMKKRDRLPESWRERKRKGPPRKGILQGAIFPKQGKREGAHSSSQKDKRGSTHKGTPILFRRESCLPSLLEG